jgi:hypothetical protein
MKAMVMPMVGVRPIASSQLAVCDLAAAAIGQAPGAGGLDDVHTEEVTGSMPVSSTQLGSRFRSREQAVLVWVQQLDLGVRVELRGRASQGILGGGPTVP